MDKPTTHNRGNGKRSQYLGRRKGSGLKFCRKCRKQAAIINTRQAANGHVTRRYRCVCGLRWTTVEHYVGGDGGSNTEHAYVKGIKTKLETEIRAEIRAALGLA